VEARYKERRLTTILAADVVGYSRLMAADESGTLEQLKIHRRQLIEPKTAQHRGRLVKLMGDGALMEFGSVFDALRFAVDVQGAMAKRNASIPEDQRINFRIGINVGDVLVEDDDIYGGGVNVAARLEGLAEPGGICVSDMVRQAAEGKLELSFEDLGQQRVKNIDRPVRVFRVPTTSGAANETLRRSKSRSIKRKWLAMVSMLLGATAVGGGVWWFHPWQPSIAPSTVERPEIPLTEGPSIAVLPFDTLGGESADYFSRGITEDIITALGRHRTLGVMAYDATLPFEGRAAAPAEVRESLGVRYLLQGSVRRAGPRVRVAAHFTDADRGMLLWSEQFDEESKHIFAIQDAIASKIVGMLVVNLTRVEQQRAFAKPTENLDAYDLVLRGRERLMQTSRRHNREARELFQQAVVLDPDYADAYAWLGRAYYQMVANGWTEFPVDTLERVEELAQKALAIDQDTIEAHRVLSRVHALQFQVDRAILEIDQALVLNPSDSEAYGDRGLILLWASRPEEAVAALETAFSYDPNLKGEFVFTLGLAYYLLRRHDDAIRALQRGATRYPDYVFIAAALVAAHGQVGQIDEARRNAEKVRRLLPIFEPATFGSRFPNPAHYEYLAEGLRKGGLL
jgi:adenylate cyclase